MTNNIGELTELLRQHNLRRTVARVAILRHLVAMPGPQTAAEIENAVAEHGFDQSTVYRTLESFNEAGLVIQRELGDRLLRFELVDARNTAVQPYYLCVGCGRVLRLSQCATDGIVPAGFQIEQITIRGRCPDCAEVLK
ncbi:Fur family transcriptional regulator [Thalassoroseus pseudoceratinae]|uniref:Fur family transcriptional regulator n=1 Tax=Thalassoroseus pseudoceratinae TaxID=2713176 RepID=UPI00141FDDFB|nr:transcriptional repressor [Thalassoroseus pseudoceratinae]